MLPPTDVVGRDVIGIALEDKIVLLRATLEVGAKLEGRVLAVPAALLELGALLEL